MSEWLENSMNAGIPKIKNGSKVSVGKLYTVTFNIDHHFNWFQKIDTHILQLLSLIHI